MAGTRSTTGIAKNLLIALAIVLVGGIAGSFWMGIRAKDAVVTSTVTQVQTIAETAARTFGRLDTWVHLAAVLLHATFRDTTPEEFRRSITQRLDPVGLSQ